MEPIGPRFGSAVFPRGGTHKMCLRAAGTNANRPGCRSAKPAYQCSCTAMPAGNRVTPESERDGSYF
jgi:hypothetical protein